jgi:hypothetical protein
VYPGGGRGGVRGTCFRRQSGFISCYFIPPKDIIFPFLFSGSDHESSWHISLLIKDYKIVVGQDEVS